MALELYWSSGSPFAWRVQLALLIKDVRYDSRRLDFEKGEHRTPEFLALNPRGRVPVLRDDEVGVSVWESVACLAYLERVRPETPLFGATPAEAARIWPIVIWCVADVDPPFEQSVPVLYRGPDYAAARAARITEGLASLADEVPRIEALLAGGPFMAGLPSPTAADCTLYPVVRSILRAHSKPAAAAFSWPFLPLPGKHPALVTWMARVEALPGFDSTIPPHWRGTPG